MTENNKTKPLIWVLIDKRTGNDNQAIALADSLGFEYKMKLVEYNSFVKLPNYFLSLWPAHVKKSILLKLKSEQLPDFIISCGRRTAALALYLRKISDRKTKIIQIMRPDIDPKECEIIILPQHDYFNCTLPNVVRIIGALNNMQAKISDANKELKNSYPGLDRFISVIVGGSNKNWQFSEKNAHSFVEILQNISDNHSIPLFFTFSRRTPDKVKEIIKAKFGSPNIIYDPIDKGINPYPGIIGSAEYIISTADSISMCSEAASTGTPVYVFCPENFYLKKHRFFIQQLVDLGVIKRLESSTKFVEKYDYKPLYEITKIVDIIKTKCM
jgi:uncharacterized protein